MPCVSKTEIFSAIPRVLLPILILIFLKINILLAFPVVTDMLAGYVASRSE
jgi:hypothetical protein